MAALGPPGRRARLTIVPAAVAAAAARTPLWHWQQEREGLAGSGECGARRELQPERRRRRRRWRRQQLRGGSGGGRGGHVGTPRAGPSASRPRPRPRADPGARARQARADARRWLGPGDLAEPPPTPGQHSSAGRGAARLPEGRFHNASPRALLPGLGAREHGAPGRLSFSQLWFPPKGAGFQRFEVFFGKPP